MGNHRLRQRGTAVVISQGKVLLARDRGRHRFSLPGGGIKRGEPTVSAAARELYEELGLKAMNIERLRDCDFKGSMNNHRVCLVTEVEGTPHLRGHELNKFVWWDMNELIPVFAHVRGILSKLDGMDKLDKH